VAVSFLLLVPYIVVEATNQLLTSNAAKGSWIGITLAAIDAALMPLLGRARNALGLDCSRRQPPAWENRTSCGAYLSIAVLIGLLANASFGLWWQTHSSHFWWPPDVCALVSAHGGANPARRSDVLISPAKRSVCAWREDGRHLDRCERLGIVNSSYPGSSHVPLWSRFDLSVGCVPIAQARQ